MTQIAGPCYLIRLVPPDVCASLPAPPGPQAVSWSPRVAWELVESGGGAEGAARDEIGSGEGGSSRRSLWPRPRPGHIRQGDE